MTLSHFGFGKNGEILDDPELPSSLTAALAKQEADSDDVPFPSYARLFANRGTPHSESPFSWTIDFDARRRKAREDVKPHVAEAELAKAKVLSLKEQLKALKRSESDASLTEEFERQIKERERAARSAQAKIDEISAAVFDLKAVNPNIVVKEDNRSVAEVIQNIEAEGQVVLGCLKTLNALLNF